jgi:hypothetical protein
MGWRALANGALMAEASRAVLITRFNHIAAYRPQFAEIRDMARQTKTGQVNILQIR